MFIISATKIVYKALYFRTLLKLFDVPVVFENSFLLQKNKHRRFRGIKYGNNTY